MYNSLIEDINFQTSNSWMRMNKKIIARVFFSYGLLIWAAVSHAGNLTLDDVERIALNNAPEIKQSDAIRHQLEEEAIADGQFSDPKLIANLSNMPVDTFDFSQEPMTQIQLGVQQDFPKGKSLKYAKSRKSHLALSERHNTNLVEIQTLRDVRLSWLDLFYWFKVSTKTQEQKVVFTNLLDIMQSLLGNNIAQQHDVIRAQLELVELDEKLIEIDKNIRLARAKLARRIGQEYSQQIHPHDYPRLPTFVDYETIEQTLPFHPIILSSKAHVSSNRDNVRWSCEQYKPGVTAGLVYGFRQGKNIDRTRRANFLTATVKMDMPIFGYNRQSRRISASQDALMASQEKEEIAFRNLLEMLDSQYANFQGYSEKDLLYNQQLIPQAQQYTEATLLAYKNGSSDFPALAHSYIMALDIKISGIKARVEREKAHALLLFLKGDGHG